MDETIPEIIAGPLGGSMRQYHRRVLNQFSQDSGGQSTHIRVRIEQADAGQLSCLVAVKPTGPRERSKNPPPNGD